MSEQRSTNLEVSLGEGAGHRHIDLAIAAGDSNEIAEVVHLVVDLDVLSKELLLRNDSAPQRLRRWQSP